MRNIRIWKSKRFYEFRFDNFSYTAYGFTSPKVTALDIAKVRKETGDNLSIRRPKDWLRMITSLLYVSIKFGGGYGLYADKNQAIHFKYGVCIGFTLLGFDVYFALTPFRKKIIG